MFICFQCGELTANSASLCNPCRAYLLKEPEPMLPDPEEESNWARAMDDLYETEIPF